VDEKNPERIKVYETIASLFLADHSFISSRSIDDLWSLGYNVTRLNQIFNKPDVVDKPLFRQIFFTYKYSSIKHFFQDNFTKFLPSPDASAINTNEKMKIFQTSFMKEYDRFADIIDNIYNITDVDKVDNTYLAYLIQILGYEKGDDTLLSNDSFRELAKNIIEIYKMKGTNYSFELFFNFLGFNISLKEFWFDKRFSDPGISINPYTNSANKDSFAFYLTPYDPTSYIPENMNFPYQVMKNHLTDIRSHLWFEKKIQQGIFVDILLGNNNATPPPEGFDYSFFKTNLISYEVTRIRSQDTDSDELSPEDEKIINAYADFLTPIFIMKQVSISVSPFEDVGELLILTDSSYYDRAQRTTVNMYHQHDEKFIIDDWVDDPLESWKAEGRAPLRFIDLVDVENNVNNEEPSDVYIWLNYPNDDLKNIADDDHMDGIGNSTLEFSSGNLMHVQTVSKEFLRSNDDYIRTLWDISFDDVNPMLSVTIGAIDDSSFEGPEELEKIVNYLEDMFNRIQRIETLNVFNRDYVDWDDFKEIRHLPSFADSSQQSFILNTFEETEVGSERFYTNNDELLTDTPWLFYDYLNFSWKSNVGNIIKVMSGRILSYGDSYRISNYINNEIIGGINSITNDVLPSLHIPAIIFTQLINTSGFAITSINTDIFINMFGTIVITNNDTIDNNIDYMILPIGSLNAQGNNTIIFNELNLSMIGDIKSDGTITINSFSPYEDMSGSIIVMSDDTVSDSIEFINNDLFGIINISSEDTLGYTVQDYDYMPEMQMMECIFSGTIGVDYFDANYIITEIYPMEVIYRSDEVFLELVDYLPNTDGATLTFGEIDTNVIYVDSGTLYIPMNGTSEQYNDYIKDESNGIITSDGTLLGIIDFSRESDGTIESDGSSEQENSYMNIDADGIITSNGTSEQESSYTDIDANGTIESDGTLLEIIDFSGESSGMIISDGISDKENHYIDIDANGVLILDGEQVVYDDYVDNESAGLIIVDGETGFYNDYVELDSSGLMISDGYSEFYTDYIETESNGTATTDGTADVEVI